MSEIRASDSVSALPETLSGSPGAILRRCREFHGITLEEASETTKIGISHLKALEDDQIREFANQAYLKGFLRIYATYLGLNSADVAHGKTSRRGLPRWKPRLRSSRLVFRTDLPLSTRYPQFLNRLSPDTGMDWGQCHCVLPAITAVCRHAHWRGRNTLRERTAA